MSNAIAELFAIRAEIAALVEQEKRLKDEVFNEYGLGRTAHDNYLLNVRENRRFDAGIAKEVLNRTEFNKTSTRESKSALVKELVPSKYALCQKTVGTVITVTLNPDTI